MIKLKNELFIVAFKVFYRNFVSSLQSAHCEEKEYRLKGIKCFEKLYHQAACINADTNCDKLNVGDALAIQTHLFGF
ncbi:hypothetical protein [Ruminococcus sp.]|uniref:hypothetical protein n=1 Tax=Ruminococcus sp. TaxID=41978 RepID=UPI0025DD84EE|nr:hypothetical protein [Ruminococcus sp.]